MSNSTATTPLEAMQALVSIHASLDKISHLDLEGLDPLELIAFQSYYQLVRERMSSQDTRLLPSVVSSQQEKVQSVEEIPLSSTPTLEEKSKTKPSKKSSATRSKSTSRKTTKASGFTPPQDSYDQVKSMFDEI